MWDSDDCDCPPRTGRAFNPDNNGELLSDTNGSPMKIDDLSLYDPVSPLPSRQDAGSPTHTEHCPRNCSLEDIDLNSRDSGFVASFEKFGTFTSQSSLMKSKTLSFSSSSLHSMDADFFEESMLDKPSLSEIPHDLEKLINAPRILDKELNLDKSPICFDAQVPMQIDKGTPDRNGGSSVGRNKTKRDDMVDEDDTPSRKKIRHFRDATAFLMDEGEPSPGPSDSGETIKSALKRLSTESDLIGDFSRRFGLPSISGRHPDLQSITGDTLVQLIKGEFSARIDSYTIIDCRYPYEFEGGHISGAVNVYTREQCLELLDNTRLALLTPEKTHILIFHCEFSSERGPNLYRFLRKEDRQKNEQLYPTLHYPEMYLLEGGYKKFYETHKEFCVPKSYTPMKHPDHEKDLRKFRQKSKTWNMDVKQKSATRNAQGHKFL